jgi:uncharacterized protein with PIN domain
MASVKRFYVDTSAYLCVLLGEAQHERLAEEIAGARLFSSALLVLEANRNLIRLARTGLLSSADLSRALQRLDADLAIFTLRDLTLDLCAARTLPVVTTPRSLDLAHLRTALWFHQRQPLTRFISLDADLNASAQELALPV